MMGRFADILGALKSVASLAFGVAYDASAEGDKRRRMPNPALRHEDAELTPAQRQRLVANARDLQRNFSLAGWMLRKHLDYVSTFNFQSKTGDKELDKRIETMVAQWSDPDACDVSGRHALPSIVRMMEARRTVDGDCGLLFLQDGRLQPIEGDRIRSPLGQFPAGTNPADWNHGVRTDLAGRAVEYSICKRWKPSDNAPGSYGWTFERTVPADQMLLHGYFERFDQVRGISPFAPGLNDLRDVSEGKTLSLAKMKVAQMFGLALYRKSSDPLGTVTADEEDPDRMTVDFGGGPFQLDLDDGEKAEFLESKSPSIEFQQWMTTVIEMALKALDLPMSFYKENYTNFSGQRQAWIQYDLSARAKRDANRRLLHRIIQWRLGLWMDEGLLPEFDIVNARPWRWISVGVPWIDPLKEVQADVQALSASLTSRTRILLDQGEFFDEVVEELVAENKTLSDAGISSVVTPATPFPTLEMAPTNAA